LAKREMLLLRIPRDTLHEMVAGQADVHRQLFDLLVTRLLTNTLQTSPLFAAFDSAQRRELATLFEVRRAAPGIVLEQQGKRSDGLYLTLAGEFRVVQGRPPGPLPPGALLGHTSILGQTPANRTVIAVVESIVLRMPAARFGDFAARFPPVLASLADLAPRSEAL
ncbi:MAG: cyclic nucleotide-binding domain-containing protein, partial [Polyangiaceae bacterium]|nr:cyclic nucleotide-binding domain-containing protein [Polyangiaceae bacterium]